MRILEVETFGRGGLAHYAFNLSRALAARGHAVTLATAVGFELDASPTAATGISVVTPIGRVSARLPHGLPGHVRRLCLQAEALADAVRIGRLARRTRPDIVHLHCTNPVALAYLAMLRRRDQPVAYTAHIVTPHEPIPFGQVVYQQIHRLNDLIIVHSTFDRHRLLTEFTVDPSWVAVIPHGEYGFVERDLEAPNREAARRALGLTPDDEVALFFGYVREYKGLDLLLESWPAVRAARPRSQLLVAGDPVQLSDQARRRLVDQARRAGARLRLEYIPLSEVASYFRAADTLVMPYRRMSQSGVLFLGLALGVAAIATRVGPLPDLLSDGDSAVLVEPESPDALADAIIRVLGDPGLRRTLAAGGQRLAAQHSWTAIAEKTEEAFEELVARHRDNR